jgi:hypothetical protein
MLTSIPPERLLLEADELLRTMPSIDEVATGSNDVVVWAGRAKAVVSAWNYAFGMSFATSCDSLLRAYNKEVFHTSVAMVLIQMQHDLRMRTAGPLNIAVTAGNVFEYFDELRKIIAEATADLLFIDPYLDAEFVSSYLPQLKSGLVVRLLTSERKLAGLLPAVAHFTAQSGTRIEVRTTSGIHDRYIIVDGAKCFQSGASFKDGARSSPTTLTQIADAFSAVKDTYEKLWSKGTIQTPTR